MRTSRRRRRSRAFALVLGGGGARGLAHIGILKTLEEHNLVPALIVGTSMGAIVGGMYAQHPDAPVVERKVRELLQSRDFQKIGLEAFSHAGAPDGVGTVGHLYDSMRRGLGMLKTTWSTGIVESPVLVDFLRRLLDDRRIEDCAIPFAAVSCDLMTGQETVHQKGSILTAVGASSAIPGVVTPVQIDGKVLVDGAPTSMVPVLAVRKLSRLPVVAVTVTLDVARNRPITNAIDVVLRAGAIARMHLAERNLEEADVVLRPNVETHGWAEFSSMDQFVAEGERAAREALRAIGSLRRRPRLVKARLTR